MAQLQVTASTSQAVGEHDKLAQSILRVEDAFNKMLKRMNDVSAASRNLHDSYSSRIIGGFDNLNNAIRTTYGWLERLAAGTHLVFSSLLKELDKIQGFNAIMSVTTGSTAKAAESFAFLRTTADRLGIQFDALSSNYAKLVAAIPPGNQQLAIAERTFLGVSMAARTLHASNQDTQLMFYAVTQIASKGVVSMEELRRQLGEKMPGALQIAARAFGTTSDELEKAIRKGIVNSEKFLAGFSAELIRTFHDSAQVASTSMSAAVNRLTNVWVDFVKEVLDSGAGQSIINIFDALREKLSDPYIIGEFAKMIGSIGDRVTAFIKSLTAEDLQRGFDSFTKAINGVVIVLEAMIKSMMWLIDNAKLIGGIVGALYGGAQGAALLGRFGPNAGIVGAVLGASIGLGVGVEGASRLEPTEADRKRAAEYEARAQQAAQQRAAEAATIAEFYKIVLKKYNLSLGDVPKFAQPEFQTTKIYNSVVDALTGKMYKSDEERKTGLLEFQKYGTMLPPRTTLEDLLKGGKTKSKKDTDPTGTYLASMGYDRNFIKEWENLNALFRSKTIPTVEALTEAQKKLMDQQPRFQAEAKEAADLRKMEHAGLVQEWKDYDELWRQRKEFIDTNQDYIDQVYEQQALSTMSNRDTYVFQGLKDFDDMVTKQREYLYLLYGVEKAEAFIAEQRRRRQAALEDSFDQQTAAITGVARAFREFNDYSSDKALQAYQMWNNVVGSMKSAWEEFVTTGRISFSNFVRVIQMEIAKITWTKYIGPMAANFATFLVSQFPFAQGGVMTSSGPMDLKRYSTGGVASSPQVAVYGEGSRPEAFVPLPDGRSIPVKMDRDSGGSVVVNQSIYVGSGVNRSEMASAMVTAKNAAVSEIRESVRRRRGL